jgi:hypothetical protein
MGNGDVDTDGDGGGVCGGEEVNGDIQWATSGVIRDALRGFVLDVMLCTDQVVQGSKELKDREQGITNVVVKRRLETLGETTREEVVVITVTGFWCKRGSGEGPECLKWGGTVCGRGAGGRRRERIGGP